MSEESSDGAFHGDPAIRQTLIATIERHLSAGTLIFEGQCWDGERGSPMGIAIEGDDPAAYSRRYGYPLPLAALLDPLVSGISDDPAAATRDWVAAVSPGADLSSVPTRLILAMLAAPEARGIDDALSDRLIALHERALTASPASRAEWSDIRRAVLDRAVTDTDTLGRAAQDLWEACTWPADRGRSTLVLAFTKWRSLRTRAAEGDWTSADTQRTQAALGQLWDQHAAARDAGEIVDYPALFMAADPALATRHLVYLRRTNERFLASSAEMAQQCIALFARAPRMAGCLA